MGLRHSYASPPPLLVYIGVQLSLPLRSYSRVLYSNPFLSQGLLVQAAPYCLGLRLESPSWHSSTSLQQCSLLAVEWRETLGCEGYQRPGTNSPPLGKILDAYARFLWHSQIIVSFHLPRIATACVWKLPAWGVASWQPSLHWGQASSL